MIIDCIGCLHGNFPHLEGGDLLIVTGDFTARDYLEEYGTIFNKIAKSPYLKKILIPGNHDNLLEKESWFPKMSLDFTYLCDSGTRFRGLNIWGSPWSAQFKGINPKCCAFTKKFNSSTDQQLESHWNHIPEDTDILITHTPPYDIFDKTVRGEKVGSKTLLTKTMEIKPKLHVFSHIHEQGGNKMFLNHKDSGTWFVNCSIMNENYMAVHKPVRITLP